MAYHRAKGLDTHIIRIFNTYGPRMRLNDGRALPISCTRRSPASPSPFTARGKQTRSFCYVSDLIRGNLSPMMSGIASSHTSPHKSADAY